MLWSRPRAKLMKFISNNRNCFSVRHRPKAHDAPMISIYRSMHWRHMADSYTQTVDLWKNRRYVWITLAPEACTLLKHFSKNMLHGFHTMGLPCLIYSDRQCFEQSTGISANVSIFWWSDNQQRITVGRKLSKSRETLTTVVAKS